MCLGEGEPINLQNKILVEIDQCVPTDFNLIRTPNSKCCSIYYGVIFMVDICIETQQNRDIGAWKQLPVSLEI